MMPELDDPWEHIACFQCEELRYDILKRVYYCKLTGRTMTRNYEITKHADCEHWHR